MIPQNVCLRKKIEIVIKMTNNAHIMSLSIRINHLFLSINTLELNKKHCCDTSANYANQLRHKKDHAI